MDTPQDTQSNELQPPAVVEPKALAKHIDAFLASYIQWLTAPKGGKTPIHVDEIASRIAKAYELIRKVIDWKDDNVLRRAAIERIIKRLLFGKLSGISQPHTFTPEYIAQTVTTELIRGGHLPNNAIPQEVIPHLTNSITKYITFLHLSELEGPDPSRIKTRHNFQTFIIELMACEIEEHLTDSTKAYGLLDAMTSAMLERIHVRPKNALSRDEVYVQTYIGTCRALFDLDNAFIIYRLLSFQYPDWKHPSAERLKQLEHDILSIWQESATLLSHPYARRFYSVCEQVDTVFALIGDVLDRYSDRPHDIMPLFTDSTRLLNEVESAYNKRYTTLRKRLLVLGIFSTLSVFTSNWFTFFLVEVPLAHLFYEGFNPFTTLIDFTVPTLVMFLLVIIIRPPPPANKKNTLEATKEFVYALTPSVFYEINVHEPRRPIVRAVFSAMYLALTIVFLFAIAWIFYTAGLPITSVVFDTLTIAVTVFAAVSIRNKSKELTVGERTSIVEFTLDMISVPVARLGSFLARKWKEYNVVAFLFTFVIETPFTVILNLIEEWSNFLKERRAELH